MQQQPGDFPPPANQQPYDAPPLGQQPAGGFQAPVKSNGKIVTGFILAAISIIVFPIIFGPIAIFLGHSAKKDGDSRGQALFITGIICMILGFILGFLVVMSPWV